MKKNRLQLDNVKAYTFRGEKTTARYKESVNRSHRHNAFIEALPEILPCDEAAKLMRRRPGFDDLERYLPPHHRLDLVQNIDDFIEPLPIYLELEQKFSRIIRHGYSKRNPISAEWKRQMRAGFPDLYAGQDGRNIQPLIRSTISGFAIIGTSGVGKSTAVESILSLYPQVIVHNNYNDQPLDRTQVVWIKLECPHNGSPKSLCLNFFDVVDEIIDTRNRDKYVKGRVNKDDLLPVMAKLAGILGVGVLVIDEIQRLAAAKDGPDDMLNFFIQMINTIGIPIVLVGTYQALPIFTRKFAHFRRNLSQGDILWQHMPQDEVWDYFVEALWKYQWTNIPTPLTAEIKETLYEETQGIIDLTVKIYKITQWHVIGEENESITPALIRRIAHKVLKPLKRLIDALKTNDWKVLQEMPDVYPLTEHLDEYLNKAKARVVMEGSIDTLRNQQKAVAVGDEHESAPLLKLSKYLVEAGYDPKIAMSCSVKALNRHATETDLKLAVKDAFMFADNLNQADVIEEKGISPSKASMNKNKKRVSLSGDLREIINKASKGSSPYDALKEAGIIKSADEFLDKVG